MQALTSFGRPDKKIGTRNPRRPGESVSDRHSMPKAGNGYRTPSLNGVASKKTIDLRIRGRSTCGPPAGVFFLDALEVLLRIHDEALVGALADLLQLVMDLGMEHQAAPVDLH